MNRVAVHRSGARLYQGGIRDALGSLRSSRGGAIRALVLCALEDQPDLDPRRVAVLRVPLDDRLVTGRERQRTVQAAQRGAAWVVERLQRGHDTLVTCHAGLNRSGLVSGLALVHEGLDARRAIEAVRAARGPDALSNPVFADIVLRGR